MKAKKEVKTTLEMAIEDINTYRSFSDVIDVRFVVTLLNTYLTQEEKQINDAEHYGYYFIEDEKYLGRYYTQKFKKKK